MNTGLQDAYNLAWKLALVLQGQADAALLDTYENERLPVAQRLLRTTDRAFQFIVSESWLTGLLRTKVIARVAAFAMTKEKVRKIAFRSIAQIGIRYRKSPLSQNLPGLPKSAPAAGDRFPWVRLPMSEGAPVEDLFEQLDDTQFNLLLIGQPEPAERIADLGTLMRTHVIAAGPWNREALARAQIPAPSCYLLRPDGHIVLAGHRLKHSNIADWFAKHHMKIANNSVNPAEMATSAVAT
jgi:hypothetical protein